MKYVIETETETNNLKKTYNIDEQKRNEWQYDFGTVHQSTM